MAKRLQALSQYLIEHHNGNPELIWIQGKPDAKEVLHRLTKLPGFADQKARIFLALLGKQLKMELLGWRETAGMYGEQHARRSVADVTDMQTLIEVRKFKKEAKRSQKH